jgi:hypothetical protein
LRTGYQEDTVLHFLKEERTPTTFAAMPGLLTALFTVVSWTCKKIQGLGSRAVNTLFGQKVEKDYIDWED